MFHLCGGQNFPTNYNKTANETKRKESLKHKRDVLKRCKEYNIFKYLSLEKCFTA